jgi:hypothetical protein
LQTNTKKTQPSNHAAEYDYEEDYYDDIVQVAPGPKTKTKEITNSKHKKRRGR